MSFTYNPYEHIELVRHRSGGWEVYCHSCGETFGIMDGYESLDIAIDAMYRHLKVSHNKTEKDFKGWSDF